MYYDSGDSTGSDGKCVENVPNGPTVWLEAYKTQSECESAKHIWQPITYVDVRYHHSNAQERAVDTVARRCIVDVNNDQEQTFTCDDGVTMRMAPMAPKVLLTLVGPSGGVREFKIDQTPCK